MNRKFPVTLVAPLLAVFLAQPALAAEPAKPAAKPAAAKPAAAKPAAKTPPKSGAKSASSAKSAAEAEDEKLRVELSDFVQQAVQLASPELQKGDTFMPYGVLKFRDGSMKTVRWQKPNPPPLVEVFKGIFFAIKGEAARDPEVMAALTVAPSEVPTTDGRKVKGIRVEVDHRRGVPQVVFIPYTHEDGKLILGTTVYQPGRNPMFDHGESKAETAAEGAPAATTEPPVAKATEAPAARTETPAAATP